MKKTISQWIESSHRIAQEHGWWGKKFNVPEKLALIHSEISEALEDYREGKMDVYFSVTEKPCGFPTELADVLIRVFDLCGRLGIDLEKALELKETYNKTRPFRHGGKKA